MDKQAIRRAVRNPVAYQILLTSEDEHDSTDVVTPLYEMAAEGHNEMYFNFKRDNKIVLESDANVELTAYDEDELRWRKPYTKLSVPEFEAYVEASF